MVSLMYLPGGQPSAVELHSGKPGSADCPAGHARQLDKLDAPGKGLYVFAGQGLRP